MIKEGQIYQRLNGVKILITQSEPVKHNVWVEGVNEEIDNLYCYITPFGYTSSCADCVINGLKLIAEYPTWRDAVNSKDFI